MTKQEYLEAAEKRYDELKRLNLITDFYDYETEFVKIWNSPAEKFWKRILETSAKISEKKNLTTLGSGNHK
ncbi:MAG: hypothetical protein IPH58_00835 [Sphingobacteriales bacterium]|nr:hypothetical protein [Sphingobacteriales bacterium]